MFLKPTAKPRRADALAAGRVARAARQPDGSRGSCSGSGSGSAAARRITSATGNEPVIDLARRQVPPGCERVQQPQLDRIDVERRRELVHLRLGREARLHGAEAAHRAARRVVRVDAGRLDQRVATRTGPHANQAAFESHRGRARGVRAAVEQDPHPHRDELALRGSPVLGPDPRRMAVDVADEPLLAAVDDLHRTARVQREHRAVDLHRQVLAPAERAADARQVDAHLLGRQAEARRHLVAVDVQPLRRDVDVDAALAVRARPGPTPARGTPGPACRPRRRPRR